MPPVPRHACMPGKLAAVGLILLSLLACALPRPVLRSQPPPPTKTPIGTITVTTSYMECGWNWATQALPELSAEVQSALQAAGLEGVTARAEAYGENCFDPESGEVRYFATMETDFRVTVEVENLTDRAALGRIAEQVLTVLDGFPPGATPGSNPGYIGIRIVAGNDEFNLWFTVTDGEAARALGLQGAELLTELENR
jgi:hypothetical protein